MRSLRILHIPGDPAGQVGILVRAQRWLGYHTYSCVFSEDWSGRKQDQSLHFEQISNKYHRQFLRLQFFINNVWKYDLFHFHAGGTFLPLNCDLPFLKALGKKMVMHYWGSEIRRKSIAERNNKFVRVKDPNEEGILAKIKRVAKYIDTAIVADYELHEYVCEHFEKVVIIRQAIELQEYNPAIPSMYKNKPVIVHAPTHMGFKGTEYIIAAIDRLKREHDLEFCSVQEMTHQQAKGIYQDADIIVDQILGGAHGAFAVEAMALGKPVLCYIREDLIDTYPKELPIVSANPDTIYPQLKILIENPSLRHELGLKGREYVEKYHDSRQIARQLIELYETL